MPRSLSVTLVLRSFFLLFLFLSNGVIHAQTPTSYVVDNTATDYTLIKAVGLPSGKSAVIYRDASYNYKCSILGSNGAITTTFDLNSKMALQNIPSRIEVNALGTSSGNIFITYTSFTSDGPPSTTNAKYLVLDQSGTQVYSGIVNSSNLGSSLNRFIQLDQLSNGNMVMIWLQSDNQSGGYRIFQSNGTPVTNDVSFAGPASTIFNSANLFGNNRVAGNPNGGFLITFEYYRGGLRGILFDNSGAVQQVGGSNSFIIDNTSAGSYLNYSALGLSNGNYVMAWAHNSSGSTYTGYYKVISSTGSSVKAVTALPSDMQTIIGYNGSVGFAANNSSTPPGFVAAYHHWQDFYDYFNPNAKLAFQNFDQSGNALTIQDGSPYFIADGNPALSVYSGNPSGVGVAYVHYKSFTPNSISYDVSGMDISASFVGASLSNIATLSNLTLSAGTLSPAFASGTTSYTASVSNATTSITVTPTVTESHATLKVNNAAAVSGVASGSIPLTVGANTITITVLAQDGVTTKTYTITVTRAAAAGVLLSSSPTITFTNSSGFDDNIAQDGEGGSTTISDFNLQVLPINSSGVKLTADPLQYHSSADWTGYPSIITYGDMNALYGWSIKSDNGAEFSLVSFSFLDWGDYSGKTYVAEAFRNGSSLGTISFTGNNSGTMVVLTNSAQLTSIFSNVDEVRVYRQGGIESWIALNNIRITTPLSLPTVTSINTASPNPTSATSVAYTVTFSGSVTGISTSNFSLSGTASNASISSVVGSGTTYTVTVNTGSVDGTVTLALANATGILPGIGTTLPFSGSQYTIDKTSPTLAITSNKSQLKAGETATITFTFSEDPAATFTSADIAVSGGTLGAISGSGTTRTAVFTPIANTNGGTASITVAAGSYQDAAGNNGGAGTTPALSFDTQAPIVTAIVRADANPTAATSITYIVSFFEAVTGVDASDFTATTTSGTAAGTVASVSGGGSTYTVTVNTVTGEGGLRLDLKNSGTGITDTYGNAISGGYTAGQSYTIGFGPATITFPALPGKTYGDADFAPGATSTNSATAITYTSSNTSVATIVSGKIHIMGAGTTTITASQPAGNGYSAATDVQQSLTVTKASATLTFSGLTQTYNGTPRAVTVTTSPSGLSGVAITYDGAITAPTAAGSYAVVAKLTNSNYTATDATGTLIISTATPTITFTALPTKTYGDADFAPGATSNNTGTPITFSSSNTSVATIVGNKIHIVGVGTTTITASQAADANYNAATNQQQSLTVNPKSLTVILSNTPAISKVYDGTTNAITAAGNYTLNGVVGSDMVTVSGTASYDNANAGTGKTVTVNNFTLAGAQKDNYTLSTTSATTTGIISTRAVTVTADAKGKVYGQSDPALTYTQSPALLPGDSFTGSLTRDAGENAGTYAIKQGTLSAGNNYSITYVGANLAITPVAITIAADAKSKIYGGSDPALTYHITSGALVPGDAFSGTLTRDAGENTGTYAIKQGTLNLNANYTLSYTGANLTIDKATLTITAEDKSKVYGQNIPVLTARYNGFVNGDNESSLLIQPTLSTTATASSSTGNYTIAASGAAASNYAISYVYGNLSITQATLTITAANKTKVYGAADPALTYNVSGLVGGDAVTGSLTRVPGSDAGSYAIQQGTLTAGPNYSISYTGALLTITSKELVVVANAQTKTYGDADPALTYSVTGLEPADVLTGNLTRVAGEDAGAYAINNGTLSGGTNYFITYTGANLAITQKAITVSAHAQTKTYGDADPTLTYSINGLVGNDGVSGTLVRTAGNNVGAYAITQGSLTAGGNYTITYTGADLTITSKAIVVNADAQTKTYGDPDPALTYNVNGLVGSDVVTGNLTRVAGNNVGSYTIQLGTVSAGANYSITYNSADLTINPKAVSVSVQPQSKIYGEADPALTYTVTPALIGGDAFSGALSRVSGEDVGAYAINQATLALSSNYVLNYTGAQLTITKKAITISADAKSKTYGDADPALTYSVSGLVGSDALSGLLIRTAGEDVGRYHISQGSIIASNNYTINYTGADLTITPKALVINADAKTKVYGSADPALTYNISGLVGNDVATGELTRTSGNNVGTYAIQQGSLSASTNYTVIFNNASLTITPKAVTVTAQPKNKTYGQADPAFTYTVSPALVGSDVFSGGLNRTSGEDAGTYAIKQGSLANPNYAISFTEGVLTIEKAAQQITWVQTLTAGCDGIARIVLTASASSGLPVSYSSSDATIATINSNEVVMTGAGTVTLTAAQPGNNNYLPATPVTNTMTAKLPTRMIVKRWDDVLVFDNSSNQYTAWQWYKNEIPVSGATGQYYYESGKLNGTYQAVVKTINGVTQQTCPVTITPATTLVPIAIFPNPVAPAQTITVKTGYTAAELQGATIVVSNMLGVVVQTVQTVTQQTNITMPLAQGLYVIKLRLANGVTASVNALVKPQ